MSDPWLFKAPLNFRYGAGKIKKLKQLTEEIGPNVVMVTDNGLLKLDFIKKIKEDLQPKAVFSEIDPNPTVTNVDELTKILRINNADVVVAIGGGSVLDCSKVACCLAKAKDDSVRPYHTGGKVFSAENGRIQLIAVPTTAGTGSEMTPFAVLDDKEKGVKGPIASDLFYPRGAIIDPELTCSLPIKITAATGLDALSHALEGYWSIHHQPICNLLAKEAGKMIFQNLAQVYKVPSDLEARSAMSYAALLAGMAFQLPKNAIVHACSFPLSNRYHLPHGTACALTLEFALKLNAPAMGGRMEEFSSYCGFESIDTMAEAIHRLKKDGGLPCTLKEAGIPTDAIETLVEESFHPLMNNNPVKVTKDHLRQMYKELDI